MAFDRKSFLELGRSAPGPAPGPAKGFDRASFLDLPGAATGPAPGEAEEPGTLEAIGRGGLSGVALGLDDEIGGLLKSAFGDQTYREARDELRAKKKAAQSAHPWAYGLSEILGGAATPGLGAAGAAKTLGSVVKAGAATGAISALGNSEADLTQGDFAGAIKDTAVGAATGAAVSGGLHKIFGKYVNSAVERRTQHLTEDIAEGAVPTAKRRLGDVMKFNPKTGDSLAVKVLDADPEFLKALGKGQSEAREVAGKRLKDLGGRATKIYDTIDGEIGGVPLGRVVDQMDDVVKAADLPGNAQFYEALEEAKNQFLNSYRRRLDLAPGQDLNAVTIPTQEVRQWVTRLKKQATASMGSLSETERKVVKDRVHEAADNVLNEHLDNVSKALPDLAPTVAELRQINQQILTYASADEALKAAVKRKAWSPQSFLGNLTKAGLPVAAGVIGAGADVISGGLAYGGARLALAGGKKLNHEATRALAGLVRAARSGSATAAEREAALRAGVPLTLVYSVASRTAGGEPSPEEE
jgi:hypothetical protein